MNYQEQLDQQLLLKYYQTSDQVYLAQLFKRYEHLIYGVCLKYSNDPDWSNDLKGQIYEKLVQKAKESEVSQVKNWLYTLAKNLCIDEIPKKQRKASALNKFKEFQLNIYDAVDSDAEERLIIKQDEDDLIKLMNDAQAILTEKQRICMRLFFFERHSYLEIVNQTGMEIKEVKSYLQNGKRKMKNYIYKTLNSYA